MAAVRGYAPVHKGYGELQQADKMFNLFKKKRPAPEKPTKAATRHEPAKATASLPRPLPLPLQQAALSEVQEGNDVSDWALWEDSVNVLDSQMQGLTPSARIYERVKEQPSEYQDIDPFSSVNRKSK